MQSRAKNQSSDPNALKMKINPAKVGYLLCCNPALAAESRLVR